MASTFEIVTTVDLAFSVGSLALLGYLLVIYTRLYRQMRQRFTLGFILFAGILALQDIPPVLFQLRALLYPRPFPGPGGSPPDALGDPTGLLFLRLIPAVLEFAALLVLVWLSRE